MTVRAPLIMTAILAISISLAAPAQAQKAGKASAPRIQKKIEIGGDDARAEKKAPKAGRVDDTLAARPDLTCVIMGLRGPEGPPFTNGATLSFGGGSPSAWVKVIAHNTAPGEADATSVQIMVRRDGHIVDNVIRQNVAMGPNSSAYVVPAVEIPLASKTHQYAVRAYIDRGRAVAESNERNNGCEFSFTGNVVQ